MKSELKFFCLTFACAAILGLNANSARAQSATPAKSPARKPVMITVRPGVTARVSETGVDANLAEDERTKQALAPYVAQVRALAQPIGRLAVNVEKRGIGGGSVGNFVSDAMRAIASKKLSKPVALAIVNTGGLRKNAITAGNLSSQDIYELLPFENALVTLELTGTQLREFFNVVMRRSDAQSGARIVYLKNDKKENELIGVRLGETEADARELDPDALYTIVTIDYLIKRGGEYALLQQAKNITPLGVTLRDAVLDYVKAETAAGRDINPALDQRYTLDRAKSSPAALADEDKKP